MSIGNKDIELIYKYLSDELSSEERKTIEQRIETEQELRTEYNMQKALFGGFEKAGEDALASFLSENHDAFVKFQWWNKWKWWIMGGVATAIIVASVALFSNPKEVTTDPELPVYKIGLPLDSIKVDTSHFINANIREKDSTPLDKAVDDFLIVSRGEMSEEEHNNFDTTYYGIPIMEYMDFETITVKTGKNLEFVGIKAVDIPNLKLIQFKNRWFLEYNMEYYQLQKDSMILIKDVRVKQQLGLNEPSGNFVNATFLHEKFKLSRFTKAMWTSTDLPINPKFNRNRDTLKHTGPHIFKEAINIDDRLYLVTDSGDFFMEDRKNRSFKVLQDLPKVPFKSQVKLQVYKPDLQKLNDMYDSN